MRPTEFAEAEFSRMERAGAAWRVMKDEASGCEF